MLHLEMSQHSDDVDSHLKSFFSGNFVVAAVGTHSFEEAFTILAAKTMVDNLAAVVEDLHNCSVKEIFGLGTSMDFKPLINQRSKAAKRVTSSILTFISLVARLMEKCL
jgi:hypothetical protein